MTTNEAEVSREIGTSLMVVTSPGSSCVATWPMSMVVPPTTAGTVRVVTIGEGSSNVVAPPITTNEAEVSNEIAMSLMVVCCPGVITPVAPLTVIAERDTSTPMGPMPGIIVVPDPPGLEMIVVAGTSTDGEGRTPEGGTMTLDVGCVG